MSLLSEKSSQEESCDIASFDGTPIEETLITVFNLSEVRTIRLKFSETSCHVIIRIIEHTRVVCLTSVLEVQMLQ